MKFKEVVDSIFVHSLMAYIILTSTSKTIEIFNQLGKVTWLAIPLQVILVALTAAILRRVTPYNQYSYKHPVNIIGSLVFILVMIVFYKLDKSGVINLMPTT